MVRNIYFSGAATAALIAALAPIPARAAETAQSQAIDEIVVTANKRPQSIYQVPTSVTAVRASDLEAAGINDLAQMADWILKQR